MANDGTRRFVSGRRYRITFKAPEDRKARTVEVNYLGTDHPGILEFDGRPEFGSMNVWREWVTAAEDIGEAIWS